MQDVPALSATSALPLGPADVREARWRVVARTAYPFVVVGLLWEIVARAGLFPAAPLSDPRRHRRSPSCRLTANGILPHHALDTVIRLLAGFALAAVVGVIIGSPWAGRGEPRMCSCR